ncbi:hypothetical protein Taro_042494 [Colocasia esculenta]|uniref:Transposase n=1 Tax=Colocasia esculenta TaxID=4460 RepID=A0A843WIL2_COLES|nr:hypothetical protein [Colocasia esculenta]
MAAETAETVEPAAGTALAAANAVPAAGEGTSTEVAAAWTASPPTTRVVPPFPSSSPPEVESQHPAVEEGPQLPGRQPCWISGGEIDPGSASRYITSLVHAHIPRPVDAWREFPVPVRDLLFDMFTRRFAFTRPEDLPRARAIWESTAQTNLRKSMWETWDKAMKTTGNRNPMAWLDYGPVWLRRDYWETLCERWAAGPWQERSQATKRNRSSIPEKNVHTSGSVSYATHNQKLHHELERAPTFRELFDQTHKRKGTDDYVSERDLRQDDGGALCRGHSLARLGSGGLGRRSRRAEEGSSVRLWGQPGYSSSVVLICEFDRSSDIREFICCAPPSVV